MELILKKPQARYWLAFVSLLFVGGFLRFFLLTNQSLWWDEGFSIYNSDGPSLLEMFARVRNLGNADKFQPLYYWILFGIRQLLGDSEIILRGFSAILGTLTLPIIYLIGLRFYGKHHALWSLGLAAFSALMILYSQEVRNYSLMLFLAALQLYFLSEVILYKSQAKSSSKWIFISVTGLSLLCSVQMAVFSASLCTSHLLHNRSWKQWFGWWLPAGILGLPAILYYSSLPGETNPSTVVVSRSGLPIFINAVYVVYGILVGTTYGPPQSDLREDAKLSAILSHLPEIGIFCVVTFLITFFLLKTILLENHYERNFQKANSFFCYLLLSSFIFSLFLALVTKINWLPRHSYFIWIPLSLLLPSVLCLPRSITHQKTKVFHVWARISIIALIVLNIYSSGNYYFNYTYWRDDYRNVAQHLLNVQSSSTKTLLVSGEIRLLKYYGDVETAYSGGGLARKIIHGDLTWIDEVEQKTENSKDVYMAVYRLKSSTLSMFRDEISKKYKILNETDSFNGFRIFHLRVYESYLSDTCIFEITSA